MRVVRTGMRRPRSSAAFLTIAFLLAGCGGASFVNTGGPPRSADKTSKPASSSPSTSPSTSAKPHIIQHPFSRLLQYINSRGGEVTAALYDARTNRTWVVNPQFKEDTASIVKVQIMGALLHQLHGQLPTGNEASLMQLMIEQSDNDAATSLLADAGGPAGVSKFDITAGLTDTTPHSAALIPGTPWPGWGLTTTTALDQVRLVKTFVFPNAVLTGAARQYGLHLMESVEADQAWGITGGVPAGTLVAVKNGWLPLQGDSDWQVDSIGWVDGHGRDYVLAVLTNGNADEADGIDTIQTIAQTLFRELRPGND
jgi:beta-lactamase class A